MPERARETALLVAWVAVSIAAWVVPHPTIRHVVLDLSWLIVVLTPVVTAITSLVRAVIRRRRGDAARWWRVATNTLWSLVVVVAVLAWEVASIAGVLQWLVLRRYIPHAAWWTVAGVLAVIIVNTFAKVVIAGMYTYVAAAGMVLGALQWLVLRQSVPSAVWWIAVGTVGWLAGAAAEALVWRSMGNLAQGDVAIVIDYAVPRAAGGLAFGLVTGLGLAWLLRDRT